MHIHTYIHKHINSNESIGDINLILKALRQQHHQSFTLDDTESKYNSNLSKIKHLREMIEEATLKSNQEETSVNVQNTAHSVCMHLCIYICLYY